MRLSKKLLLIVLLAGVAAGLAYLISELSGVPELAQFEVTGELARTEYRARERITVEPFLTYTGMRRQVTICGGIPLLFVAVYTADNVRVVEVPVLTGGPDILLYHTLRRNVPYNDKDHPYSEIHEWGRDYRDYLRAYSFRLEQPGTYKVVVRAEFSPDRDDPASASSVCSEPIWITITG